MSVRRKACDSRRKCGFEMAASESWTPTPFSGAKVRDGWINAANDARTIDSTDHRLKALGHIWKGARQAPRQKGNEV